MEILEQIKNPLFKREEIKLMIESQSMPSKDNCLKLIAEKFKSKEENIIIKKINSKFGRNTFIINAFVYNNKENKEKIEGKEKKREEKKEEKAEEQKGKIEEKKENEKKEEEIKEKKKEKIEEKKEEKSK